VKVSGQFHSLAALPPGKEPLVPFGIGGWVGPRAGHGNEEKNSQPHQESNSRTPIVQPVSSQKNSFPFTSLNTHKNKTLNHNKVYVLCCVLIFHLMNCSYKNSRI